ncbi:MAG: hypothetical protein OJI67_08255 [Prosthecobacter sp.]|nr:hypothetical protein [Prosthecobacter sp.]
MKTRLEDLIQKASVAQPPEQLSRSNWTPYLPIIRILMEERAHSLIAAVEWLVAQGEIPKNEQAKAYRALRQILARREAKKLRQQARLHRPPPPKTPPQTTPPEASFTATSPATFTTNSLPESAA